MKIRELISWFMAITFWLWLPIFIFGDFIKEDYTMTKNINLNWNCYWKTFINELRTSQLSGKKEGK